MDKLDSDADTALGFLIGQFPQDYNTHDEDAKKPEGPSPGQIEKQEKADLVAYAE